MARSPLFASWEGTAEVEDETENAAQWIVSDTGKAHLATENRFGLALLCSGRTISFALPRDGHEKSVCKICSKNDQGEIKKGEVIFASSGNGYVFDFISKQPGGNSGGKIIVTDPTVPEDEWFRQRELYPSVFDCVIVDGKLYRR